MTTAARTTKYVIEVIDALQQLTHATNADIYAKVCEKHSAVSLTTIHRVTARLQRRGVIASAPKTPDGAERYDIQPRMHHHFMCTHCGGLCDIPDSDESKLLIERIARLSASCQLTGALTLQGVCKQCITKEEKI